MRQIETVDRNQLGPDGKPLRKYEMLDASQKSTGLLFAISFVAINSLLLLKDFIFGNSEAKSTKDNAPIFIPEEEMQSVKSQFPSFVKSLSEANDNNKQDETETDVGVKSSGSSNGIFGGQGQGLFDDPNQPDGIPYEYQTKLNTGSHLIDDGNENNPLVSTPVKFSPSTSGSPQDGSHSGGGRQKSNNNAQDDNTTNDGPNTQRNRLPVILAPAFLLDLYVNQSIILGQSLLLENAIDPDGDPLEITFLKASSGTLIETNNGEWSYTPIPYDLSVVTLTYRISDDEGSVLQTATLNYHPFEGKELSGTEGHDNLFGTPGPDVIVGYGGNDLIISREDGDVIKAGDGNDRIVGGQGNDVIYAEAGDDVVFAGTGDDYVSGGAGDDFIEGEEGNDTLEGDDGDDNIFGGQGNDRIFGGSDDDNLSGGEGNDFISGDDGDDDISAGDGDDVITAGNGNDKSNGDKGDDTFIAFEQDGDDEYKGGEGADTVDYSSVRQNKETEPNTNASEETNTAPQMESSYSGKTIEGVKIDLINQEAYSHSTGLDKLDSIENVKGSQLDDVIIADEAVNILTGNDGDDRFVFKTDNSGDRNTEDRSYKRDVIIDFEVGDKIDISELDGSHVEDGLQKLIFKYDQAEFDGSGQFIYGYEDKESGTSTILKFKFDREDDDDDPDYEIELVGHYEMDDDHFYF